MSTARRNSSAAARFPKLDNSSVMKRRMLQSL